MCMSALAFASWRVLAPRGAPISHLRVQALVRIARVVHQALMGDLTQTTTRLRRLTLLARGMSSSDFDLNDDRFTVERSKLRPAAVMMPVIEDRGDFSVILTKRTSALRHHPGQIAFPGGKQDAADTNLEATALREAQEEIGLSPDRVELLGPVGLHDTVTQFRVTPFLALVDPSFVADPDPNEVESVFRVPLSHIVDPDAVRIEGRIWQGVRRRYYVVPFGPHYIWGATARMIVGLQSLWTQADAT